MTVKSSKKVKIFWKFYRVYKILIKTTSESVMYVQLFVLELHTPKTKIDFVDNPS